MRIKPVVCFLVSCCICAVFFCAYIVSAQAAETYKLSVAVYKAFINSSEYNDANLPILNYEGSTYAPMRSMLEAFGLKVEFANSAVNVETAGASIAGGTSAANEPNVNDYMSVREIFEFTNLMPVFVVSDKTIQVRDSNSNILLTIPKEYTHEFADSGLLMIQKSYYDSTLKPMIEKYKN